MPKKKDEDEEEVYEEDEDEDKETDETQVEENPDEVQVAESFVKTEPSTERGVINSEVSSEVKKAYLDYAMSVIVSRAIPAIEDGMKPVQRRILYSMQQMGLKSNTQTKKSARIVGECMGKYHPHGDVAVYDAMVRMAQDFSLRYPLVYGQGNFGCFTADTKVKLADGRDLSFLKIIEENKKGKRNFTFTIDKGIVKIAEIKSPRLTRKNAEIMKVVLDNGEEIRCTLNHKFMLRDGSYKEAKDLISGESLMPLYNKLSTKEDNPRAVGYSMIYQPKTDSWNFVHVLSDAWNLDRGFYQKSTGRIRHHIDFNKLNNNPNNIRRMHWKEHWKAHYEFTSNKHKTDEDYRKKLDEGRKRFWNKPSNRTNYSKRMSEKNKNNWKKPIYREKMSKFLSEINKEYLRNHPERIEEIRIRASNTMKEMWKDPIYRNLFNKKIVASNKKRETNLTGKKKFLNICKYLIENNLNINKENYESARKKVFGTKSFTSWNLGIKKYFQESKNLILLNLNSNHKVVRTEFLREFVDVYDLTIDKTHNFSLASGIFVHNSLDGDPPAAMRYTEAKLEKLAEDLLEDLDKETVGFLPNFDNSLKEPVLLPGKVPALMLNGATGIAVGMATNIPPHNLREVSNAIIRYIENPNITLKELLQTVTGPDFPTGGSVQGDMNELYETGRGRLVLRGRIETEEKKGRTVLVITEIPYMVNKSVLITQIANLVRDKKIRDISDLRDESNKGKIRIVLELRKGVNPKFVINGLYKYTRLQDSFNVNFLALEKGKPKILGLIDVLRNYVEYRKEIVTKRTKFDLKKAEARQEIVQGLIKALLNIDRVIKIIRHEKDPAKELKDKFKFTENQVKAILETRLRQLTSLEEGKLKDEEKDLEKKIKEYQKILGDIKEVLKIIKKEVLELKEKYGDPRRTQVLKRGFNEISEKDLVQEKEVVVSITDKGYVKRMDVVAYKEQRRGGKGVIGSSLTTGDFSKQMLTCSTHDYLMFFTSRGRVLWLKAYDVPEAERYGKGKAIVNLLGLKEENVTKVISIKNFEDFLMMATRNGVVKKISLSYFSNPRASGVKAINLPLDNSDDLIGVEIVKEGQEVSLATKNGKAIRFNSNNVRSMGRSSYGVTGINLSDKDQVVSLEVLDTDAIFTITKNGYGKRTAVEDYRKTARAGKGVINLKVNEKTGEVVNAISVNDKDSIIITTAMGQVIRMSLKQIRVMGRVAQGVRVVKLQKGDHVTDVVKVHDEEQI